MSQFQNSSKLSKRPRFALRKGAFSAVTLQVAASNYPLQFFAMPSLPSFELLLKLPLTRKKTPFAPPVKSSKGRIFRQSSATLISSQRLRRS